MGRVEKLPHLQKGGKDMFFQSPADISAKIIAVDSVSFQVLLPR